MPPKTPAADLSLLKIWDDEIPSGNLNRFVQRKNYVDANLVLQVGFGIFALCAGLAFYARYNRHEKEKIELINALSKDKELMDMAAQLEHAKKSAENYRYKINRIRSSYDVDFDDVDIDTNAPNDELLPAIVDALGDKLPPSLKPILANPKVLPAISNVIEKHPELLEKAVSMFVKKDDAATAPSAPSRPMQYGI